MIEKSQSNHLVEISATSEAFRYLENTFKNGFVYKLSVDIRSNGMAFKINEGMWTPTLSVKSNTGRDDYN